MGYKVALVSDSHGNLDYINIFLNNIESQQVDQVIHLGDNYDDCQPIIDKKLHLTRVPGTWTPYYLNKQIDNRLHETINDWHFFLTHTPTSHYNDLNIDEHPEDVIKQKKCDIFCHGHTHHPKVENINDVWVINPGHIKDETDRGYPATYAILDLNKASFTVTIYHLLDNKIFLQKECVK